MAFLIRRMTLIWWQIWLSSGFSFCSDIRISVSFLSPAHLRAIVMTSSIVKHNPYEDASPFSNVATMLMTTEFKLKNQIFFFLNILIIRRALMIHSIRLKWNRIYFSRTGIKKIKNINIETHRYPSSAFNVNCFSPSSGDELKYFSLFCWTTIQSTTCLP